MTDRIFEAGFEIEGAPNQHWTALEALQASATDRSEGQWYLPGFESTGTALDVDPGRWLRVRKDTFPCEGTTIEISFEPADPGTAIRVVQRDFDPDFLEHAGDSFWMAAEHIAADFELFFRFGVQGGRHARPWSWTGWRSRATSMGIEVFEVHDGTYAARVGLAPGDIVLTLAGAPLLTERDLATVLRVVGQGDEVEVTWVRDGQHHTARTCL